MQQSNRINDAKLTGRKKISFTFDGKKLEGYEGDSLAAALLANDVKIVARSFKYHRPRGIVGAGAEEPNAIVQLETGAETIPNLRATQVELYEGLVAKTVTGWPSLKFDILGSASFLGRFMPPGFYYKTFMYSQSFWMWCEKYIRKFAGLGDAPTERDPDEYDKLHHHCDILIIGGGPSGLKAALTASQSGARVIIADEQSEFGGSLLSAHASLKINEHSPRDWLGKTLKTLYELPNVTLLSKTTVMGQFDHGFCVAVERVTDHIALKERQIDVRQRLHKIEARKIILASGTIERPIVFANNDVPGVMMASAVSTYINRYHVRSGKRLVLFTNNDHAYLTALDWHSSGGDVAAIVDVRTKDFGEAHQIAVKKGINVLTGHGVYDAIGSTAVKAALIKPINNANAYKTKIPCDTIAVSGGWNPVVHISSHLGHKPKWNEAISAFIPSENSDYLKAVGGANGKFNLNDCMLEADAVTAGLIEILGFEQVKNEHQLDVSELKETCISPLFLMPHFKSPSRSPKQFVDFQLDVTAAGIELAALEGYHSVEHVKRYTAMGFGTDQGKLGNINGLAILAQTLNQPIEQTGTTVFRPAYTPTTFGALAGRDVDALFDPERYTAMHRWHEENGAKWEDVGQWKRPWYFPKANETMQETLSRECLAVRNSVGILDASTLGKIDIQGPDAAEFITRIYTNAYMKLAPGKCRYGVMLKEDGMIFDDGVTACLGENHYLMFTTTGGAANVLSWLELWHQTEWPDMKVFFTSVTDHWTTATVTGPNARKVIEKVCDDIDLSGDQFKFMDWKDGTVAGVKARIFRISFTGELSFEVNVPAHYGRYIWEKLIEAGKEFDITPYGTETMHILRAEKGFIIVGQDTDGSVTPYDMNMGWVVGKKKEFSFLGKRSLERADTTRANRKQFVGLKPKVKDQVIPEGAQIVNDPNHAIPIPMEGHVTSSYFSANLGYSFALAVVKGGLNRMGDTVYCPLADGSVIEAEITSSIFYDPKGDRQNV